MKKRALPPSPLVHFIPDFSKEYTEKLDFTVENTELSENNFYILFANNKILNKNTLKVCKNEKKDENLEEKINY